MATHLCEELKYDDRITVLARLRPPLTLAKAQSASGRLTSHANDLGSFTLAWLGQTGQIASRQLGASTLATTWTYLPNSGDRRLASISTAGLSAGQSTAFAFTSNAGGFITGQVETSDASLAYPPNIPAMNATFNSLNQMATLNTRALTWDADGNLLSDGTHTYSWDAENRLVAIAYAGQPTQSTTFAYDGLGRRVTITSTPAGGGAAATSYIWCGMAPCQARNAANAVTRAYYAEGEFSPGSPAVSAYYAPDQIGSVRRVFTSASAPAYDFDPYGTPLQATAPATDYVWAGMLNQADAGLYLTPARAYSPALGRWLSRDPVGEETDPDGNLYPYVGGNPVSIYDPLGLWSLSVDFYKGIGGGLTVGWDASPGGGFFVSARAGVGLSQGAELDPNGGAPGKYKCPPGTKYGNVGGFAQLGGHVGPLGADIVDARAGLTASSNGWNHYVEAPAPHIVVVPHPGLELGGAIGVESSAFFGNN